MTSTTEEDYTGSIIISLQTMSPFVQNLTVLPHNCPCSLASYHSTYARSKRVEEKETKACSDLFPFCTSLVLSEITHS